MEALTPPCRTLQIAGTEQLLTMNIRAVLFPERAKRKDDDDNDDNDNDDDDNDDGDDDDALVMTSIVSK